MLLFVFYKTMYSCLCRGCFGFLFLFSEETGYCFRRGKLGHWGFFLGRRLTCCCVHSCTVLEKKCHINFQKVLVHVVNTSVKEMDWNRMLSRFLSFQKSRILNFYCVFIYPFSAKSGRTKPVPALEEFIFSKGWTLMYVCQRQCEKYIVIYRKAWLSFVD